MTGILSGLRVIEGSAFVAAPSAGMTLAQMGADVIRYDPIGGGLDYRRWPVTANGTSLYWTQLNKGKRSIAIDLRSEEGRALLTDLITAPGADAGLYLTNFPATGWMSYEKLSTKRADLIMVNILGNPDGTSAVDYTVNSAIGFPFITGHENDDIPVNNVVPAWDLVCGQQAVVALLAAERHRQRTGAGQLVKIALADIGFAALANLGYVGDVEVNKVARTRGGNDIYGTFGRHFRTKDKRYVMIAALAPGQWQALLKATGLEATAKAIEARTGLNLANEGDRYRARADISAALEEWTSARSAAEIETAFKDTGVLWGPYRTVTQALAEDGRLSETNEMFRKIDQPGIGPMLTPASPMRFGAGNEPPLKGPRLGAHTDEILSGVLGLSSSAIAKLHDKKIIAGPEKATP